METKIKNTVPFIFTPKKVKYLGIYLIKRAQDLYAKNYKRLRKEIKEDLINGKTFQ